MKIMNWLPVLTGWFTGKTKSTLSEKKWVVPFFSCIMLEQKPVNKVYLAEGNPKN
jgi:hypothetical protein